MKKLLVLALLLSPSFVFSQALEFSFYGGYMVSGTADYYYYNAVNSYVSGEIDLNNGGVYGATVGVEREDGIQIQFLYNYYKAESQLTEWGNFGQPAFQTFDIVTQHFHLGIEKSIAISDMVKPYGAISLGMTSYNPDTDDFNSVVRFSMALGGGLKIWPTEKIGLKMQAKMFMPMTLDGVGIYCGSGGCGGGSSFHVPIVHGEFSGGVIFRLEQ
ncbi:MAG: porin family protein [Reichenbachiella sp.]